MLFLLVAFMMVSPDSITFSDDIRSDPDYQEYLKYQDEGILDQDITFEYWKELVERSKYLEEVLENSGDFDEVYSSNGPNKLSSFTLVPGDVIVSNGASSAGIAGHAGIASASTRILHISGRANEPAETISLDNWHNNYTNRTSSSWTRCTGIQMPLLQIKLYNGRSLPMQGGDRCIVLIWIFQELM